jgi:hypothetical protein
MVLPVAPGDILPVAPGDVLPVAPGEIWFCRGRGQPEDADGHIRADYRAGHARGAPQFIEAQREGHTLSVELIAGHGKDLLGACADAKRATLAALAVELRSSS